MESAKPHSSSLRGGRYSQPGQFYFLTTSTNGRRRIFLERHHACIVLEAIRWLHSVRRFDVDAAVIMPDHLHLVGKLGEYSLDRIMHSLKSFSAHQLVSRGINPRIWQDGYHDHGLRSDDDYRTKVRYVLRNPVRAGLVRRVEDYPHIILPSGGMGWWINVGANESRRDAAPTPNRGSGVPPRFITPNIG